MSMSPSMRRVWIEICHIMERSGKMFRVTLHAEGVD